MNIDIKIIYQELDKILKENPFKSERTQYDEGVTTGIHICCDKIKLFLKNIEKQNNKI